MIQRKEPENRNVDIQWKQRQDHLLTLLFITV